MEFRRITENKKEYLPLLLLGDEQESMIDRYLDRGELFVLWDEKLRTAAVVTVEGEDTVELKNLATMEDSWNQGYAVAMMEFLESYYGERYRFMQLGTGENPQTLGFYEHRGYTYSHRVKDFFVDNYDHPIIECGKPLKDMIYLKKELGKGTKEFFDLRTSDGELTGRIKCREDVHRDGDWHGTVHMWVANRNAEGRWRLLLQKRSLSKDNYPGFLDISSAGHLSAGDTFEEAAYRELSEELGLHAEKGDLKFLFYIGRRVQEFFHGHEVNDREIAAVYLYEKPLNLSSLKLQKEEVDEVSWIDLEDLEALIRKPDSGCCVYGGEIRKLKQFLD